MKPELIREQENRASIRARFEADEVARSFERVLRQLGKNLRIPGFRPGKVPPNIVRNRVSTEELQERARDEMREAAVRHALKELELEVRSLTPEFSGDELPRESEPYEVKFEIPLMPKVVIPDYDSFRLPIKKLELSEEMKQQYKERLRDRFTEYKDKPGAVEMGDAVLYDLETRFSESDEAAPLAHQDALYRTGEPGNLPGYDEHFVGKTAPAEFSFNYTMPEDFANDEVSGKELTFHVTLKAVKDVVRPELTLDFVRERFQVADMHEFDKMVDDSLSAELEAQEEAYREEVALEQVAGRTEAHISQDMVKQEIDYLVSSQERRLRAAGQSLAAALKQRNQSLEELREELKEPATKRIREFLVVKAISETEGFKVSREELARYAGSLARKYSFTKKQITKLLKNREFLNDATEDILRAKVKRHLAQAVTFYYEGEEPPDSQEGGTDAGRAPTAVVDEEKNGDV